MSRRSYVTRHRGGEENLAGAAQAIQEPSSAGLNRKEQLRKWKEQKEQEMRELSALASPARATPTSAGRKVRQPTPAVGRPGRATLPTSSDLALKAPVASSARSVTADKENRPRPEQVETSARAKERWSPVSAVRSIELIDEEAARNAEESGERTGGIGSPFHEADSVSLSTPRKGSPSHSLAIHEPPREGADALRDRGVHITYAATRTPRKKSAAGVGCELSVTPVRRSARNQRDRLSLGSLLRDADYNYTPNSALLGHERQEREDRERLRERAELRKFTDFVTQAPRDDLSDVFEDLRSRTPSAKPRGDGRASLTGKELSGSDQQLAESHMDFVRFVHTTPAKQLLGFFERRMVGSPTLSSPLRVSIEESPEL